MARISASSYNNQSKCELAFHLSKSEEGRTHIKKKGPTWAFAFGSMMHDVVQTFDTDRFEHKMDIPVTEEELGNRYVAAWTRYFTDETSIKKNELSEETCKYALQVVIPTLEKWRIMENPKEAAQMEYYLKNTVQVKLPWKFSIKKSLPKSYLDGYLMFQDFVLNNPFEAVIKQYGMPIDFQIEKNYLVQLGPEHTLPGYVDERLIFEYNGRRLVYLREFKSSATPYTPEDCQVDNQMGIYIVCEHFENGTPISDIFVCMHQLTNNVVTVTQRSEENISFLLSAYEERLKRQDEIEKGLSRPMPVCGTNSFDHSRLMCDYKDICPVWCQMKTQTAPIILGQKE